MPKKKKNSLKEKKVKQLHTVAEVSEMTGLAPTQILYRIKTDQIEAEKIGWFWVISKEEVDRLIEEMDEE